MNTMCLCCEYRTALPRHASLLQLCQSCLDTVYPGADTARYDALRAKYGYSEVAAECNCRQDSCYSCRRQQIDTAALEIVAREYRVLEGFMTPEKLEAHAWSQANLYRCNAINALAFEMA